MGRPPAFKETQKTWIIGFLKRSNISYTCPGRKDAVYVGKSVDGERQYHAKHYLLWYIKEIVPMMNEEIQKQFQPDEQFKVSYGSRVRFIKPISYMRYRDDMPETTCTCEYCENLELILSAVKLACPETQCDGSTASLMKNVMFDPLNLACVNCECDVCGIGNEFYLNLIEDVGAVEEVTYHKWVVGGKYPEKQLHMVSGQEAADEMAKQIRDFKRHNYNNIRQHIELDNLKTSLPGTNSAIVQVDFSENYDNKQRNEIQCAYFGHQSFSIYTACVWYGCHNEYPADVCLTWSFFESHHGKGPVDDIGGKVKSTVYNDVKAGLVILGDAQQFAAYANKRVQATEVVFVGSEEIHNDHPQIPGKVP
ncbi:hypothetical protein HOLleu_05901 [Holothuria leucospilota]|uniref:Uncharacterized protein n=1 Tax=Holothuria leucospilota TaxID=206669 RepID=A0A9Q1HIK0_HOLLE|nr:hypothetical protein HOLleu_05901 [Holothuria leucospilota]